MARSAEQKRVHVLYRGRLVPKDQLPTGEAKPVEVKAVEVAEPEPVAEPETVSDPEPVAEYKPAKKRGRPPKQKPEEDVSAFELKD